VSCLVDQVSIQHGRDDTDTQPDASSATVDFSFDTTDVVLPDAVEIGAMLDVSTQLGVPLPAPVTMGTGLAPNPSFEIGGAGWNVYGAGPTYVRIAGGVSGGWMLKVSATQAGTQGVYMAPFPVTPGDTLQITGHIQSTVKALNTNYVWRNAGGSQVGVTTAGAIVQPSAAWQRAVYTVVVPATAATLETRWYLNSSTGAEFFHLDAVLIHKGTAPLPYFDGDTPDTATDTYSWSGAAHNSQSTWVRNPAVLGENLLSNPSLELGVPPWTGARGTLTREAIPHPVAGTWGGKYTTTVVDTVYGNRITWPVMAAVQVAPGHTYTYAIHLEPYGGQDGKKFEVLMSWYTAASVLVSHTLVTTGDLAGGRMTRIFCTGVCPAGAARVELNIRTAGGAPPAVGDGWYWDAASFSEGALVPYFDGDTADTATDLYGWSGAAHASASTRQLRPPATSVRFHGRITDVALGWDDAGEDTPERPVGQLVATGILADLGRRVVGAVPFPQELDGARVQRVLAAAGIPIDPLTQDPGTVQVLARDIDSQPALDVAQEAATSARGVLWTTRAGLVCYADAEHRRNQQPALQLDACDVLVTPTWKRTTQGLINDVSLGYGPPPEEGEQPRWLGERADSKARYGTYAYSLTTVLAALADAEALGTLLLTRNSAPVWVMAALPIGMADLDADRTVTLLGLDLHSLVNLTGLPAVGSAPTTAVLWVEGIAETLGWRVHDLELAVSGYCRTSPPPRWDDLLPALTWDTAAGTWDEMACLLPQPSQGRWADVSASLHWDQTAPSVTWDTWKG
jgi:hypothetical protein